MTRQDIIKAVQQDTAGIRNATLDWNTKFNQALQELCAEHKFWWRKKYLSFPTVANTGEYDLASIGTETPTGAGAMVEEITQISRITDSTTIDTLDPVTDDAAIQMYINDTASKDKPTVWIPDPRDLTLFQKIILRPIPNAVYTMLVSFWAMPNPAQDASDDAIYVVPAMLHHVIQTYLETEVWRLAVGVKDDRYVTALNERNKKVAQAKIRPSFADADDGFQFMNFNSEAVRSTR